MEARDAYAAIQSLWSLLLEATQALSLRPDTLRPKIDQARSIARGVLARRQP